MSQLSSEKKARAQEIGKNAARFLINVPSFLATTANAFSYGILNKKVSNTFTIRFDRHKKKF